jgi:hypothetical protein
MESISLLSTDKAQKYISVIFLNQNDLYLMTENVEMFKFVARKTKEI